MVDHNMCLESDPCKHRVSLYKDGILVENVILGARKIISMYKNNGLLIPAHFKCYDN